MLTVIFCSFGTALLFFQPKRFISAGTVSLRYFSCNRLFIAFFYLVLSLSSVVLQCRQLRTFVPSGSTVWPIRVCLPQLPQTTITFETLIPASFSTIPPLMFFEGLGRVRSEEHTSELQSRLHLVCRLLLEKKKTELKAMLPGEAPVGLRV